MKKRRKNPAFKTLPAVEVDSIMAIAGSILVTQALKDCTFEEKVLISALIPLLVKLLRNAQPTQEEMDKAVEKILKSGNDQADLNEAEGDGSPK